MEFLSQILRVVLTLEYSTFKRIIFSRLFWIATEITIKNLETYVQPKMHHMSVNKFVLQVL